MSNRVKKKVKQLENKCKEEVVEELVKKNQELGKIVSMNNFQCFKNIIEF